LLSNRKGERGATLSSTPTTLPHVTRNSSYSQTLSVSSASTYTFSLLIGGLPPGFMLSSAGVLSSMTNQTGTFDCSVSANRKGKAGPIRLTRNSSNHCLAFHTGFELISE
jgi:hypothetical protein